MEPEGDALTPLEEVIADNVTMIQQLNNSGVALEWPDLLLTKIDLVIGILIAHNLIDPETYSLLWENRVNGLLRNVLAQQGGSDG